MNQAEGSYNGDEKSSAGGVGLNKHIDPHSSSLLTGSKRVYDWQLGFTFCCAS